MDRKVIAISPSGFAQVSIDRLVAAGFDTRMNKTGRQLTEDEALEHLRDVVGLVAGTEPLTRRVLAASPSLKVIARVGTGMDSVDVAAAKELGIQVFNTPDAHVDAVAELTLAGILAVARKVALADRAVRTTWKKPMGRLVRGTTVGFVGFGRVAKAVARLLAPFEVKVLAFDPIVDPAFPGAAYVGLDELLENSDIVSLHLPYTKAAHNVIGAAQLARMKPEAILVNTARGKLVDEDALHAHLVAHPEAGCYLDCFAEEPYLGPLRALDNILLTSHIGGYARESRLRMEMEAVEHALSVVGAG